MPLSRAERGQQEIFRKGCSNFHQSLKEPSEMKERGDLDGECIVNSIKITILAISTWIG